MRRLWILAIVSIYFVIGARASLAQESNVQESKGTASAKENCRQDKEQTIQQNGSTDFGKANNSWNEPERALDYYRQALAKGYDTVELRIQFGRLLSMKLGRHAEACEQLRIAIQREPDNSRAHDALAKALLANKQYEDALSELETVGKLDPRTRPTAF